MKGLKPNELFNILLIAKALEYQRNLCREYIALQVITLLLEEPLDCEGD